MRFVAAIAMASIAAATSFEDGNHITLKGYSLPISGLYGDTALVGVTVDSNFDVGVFYKFPFGMKWGKEFQTAQELVLYMGGKQSVDVTFFDRLNIKVTAELYPGYIQLLRNDIFILWPKDTFLDKIPEEADTTGESGESDVTGETQRGEGELNEDQWYCMDTKYGYALGWYKFKMQIGAKGCDFSVLDKLLDDTNLDCNYSNYYFDKLLEGSLWGKESWGLRYTCPWSSHLETTGFNPSKIKDSIEQDLEENTL